jgi:ABC-type uncharacterized transport system permease subunit
LISFTVTISFSLETFTISNNAVAGIPVKIDPGSMYFLLIKPLIGAFTLVSPTLIFACLRLDSAFVKANFA